MELIQIYTIFRRIGVIFCFILALPLVVTAKHIIGGVIYYEYISSPDANTNRYKLIMLMYRDCLPGPDKADFDGLNNSPQALFSIYNGTKLIGGSYDFGSPTVKPIEVDVTNKCLVKPPNVCVEEGRYEFTIDLPISTSSYTIVYQRCCRNNTISNVIRPGDIGATFFVEILPQAQLAKNSTPTFDKFPPIAICSGYPLFFDHKGTDKDGDSLTYELCAPLKGGGNIQTDPGVYSCYGITPSPDCPPPYASVDFRAPYTALNPLGGSPSVTIDRKTGLLSGTPKTLGQFVMGICMKEYRNGVLMSEVRRDFQFNLASCERTVNALSEINGVESNSFDIKLCGDTVLNILNKSTLEANIIDYRWEFYHGTDKYTATTKDFSLPISLGVYTGTMYLNHGLQCSDSMNFKVRVFPDIRADFTFDYDTCFGKVIDFQNKSVSDAGPITATIRKASETVFANTFNAQFNTLAPQTYQMEVIVSDQNQCQDSISKPVPFYPLPKEGIDPPRPATGCEPYLHQFDPPKRYLTSAYSISWDFGDGSTGSGVTPTHLYEVPGIYNIQIDVTNPFGCKVSGQYPQVITILQSPDAGFSFTPEQPSNFDYSIDIKDESVFSTLWNYVVSDGKTYNIPDPSHTFQDTGLYTITQYVTASNGCKDTLTKRVDVVPKYTLYLPNAFTPGLDGLNDTYKPAGIPFGIKAYTIYIFDRWGNQLFKTNDFHTGWNGKDKNGQNLTPGTYAVRIIFTPPRGKPIKINGIAVLIQ